MEMLNNKQKILVIGGVIVIAIIFIFYYINSTKDVYSESGLETAVEEKEEKKEDTEDIQKNKIIIHITGAVKNEGIVEVNENARINDVIEKAGRNNKRGRYTKC